MEFEQDQQATEDQTTTEGSPSTADGTSNLTEQQIIDLDTAEKVKWQGKEWTNQELKDAYMMKSDYTRKTQAIAEEKKYISNLSADLDLVSKNPALAAEFKKIYPESYHSYLKYVLSNQPEQAANTQKEQVQQMTSDPQLLSRLEKVEKIFHDQQVAAIDAELDVKFKQMSEKYPMADEEAVIARAQTILNQGQALNDAAWDKLWKDVNDKNQKMFEQHYNKQIKEQKTANQRGKDVAAGGGIVGQAPNLAKTIKEASARWRSEMGIE